MFLFHLLRSVHLNMGVCTVYKLWLHIVLERLQSGGQTIIEAGTVIYETTYNSDTNSEWHEQSERESEHSEADCLPKTVQDTLGSD